MQCTHTHMHSYAHFSWKNFKKSGTPTRGKEKWVATFYKKYEMQSSVFLDNQKCSSNLKWLNYRDWMPTRIPSFRWPPLVFLKLFLSNCIWSLLTVKLQFLLSSFLVCLPFNITMYSAHYTTHYKWKTRSLQTIQPLLKV